MKLTTFNNDRFISNHNCSITNITDYQKKISDNITKLKERFKNTKNIEKTLKSAKTPKKAKNAHLHSKTPKTRKNA